MPGELVLRTPNVAEQCMQINLGLVGGLYQPITVTAVAKDFSMQSSLATFSLPMSFSSLKTHAPSHLSMNALMEHQVAMRMHFALNQWIK